MKTTSLLRKTLTQFIICTVIILLLTTPLFYLLTKHFYAEDMIDLIEVIQNGHPMPQIDLERDIMKGLMLQFALISCVLGIAIVLMMRFISRRLWIPFDETLKVMEHFHLEDGTLPTLPGSDIKEFDRLNRALNRLMDNSLKSYCMQKEFTENASHELQTPLAVFQSKLDLLLQQPNLTEEQADCIQNLYQTSARLTRLNRNLLLLAKIENSQYKQQDNINVTELLNHLLPTLQDLAQDISIRHSFAEPPLIVQGNTTLFESLAYNLFVNAVRHNKPSGGSINIYLIGDELTVSNTSSETALDSHLIFNRFYRPSEKIKGNGLGLSIVKAICDYHGWKIRYDYEDGQHLFTVKMREQ
ncbi:HAMP domain-containing sensor histidine kinase [Bacteroides helcogenes]|uniref:histidine kinase n=1 Tax=Bacteroides helcogenes (strain ATCC 35417 / DSM 20613 / JCM 6297 / CCUG 15421 / P 36-108) TaxID=693979 RepID=E6SRN8_BACT6|nr:HAMP domain-containing sensor histidine kinase [Bacteroides helcogenes]ADV45128.1 integral membrane sensor signal transduction histidine kinase [Bacteroides helcogenes P 36-108]MDY5238687.1 HAMP domain-containing sensor histidine kinase [Bacteroides helcogenes]